MGGLTVKPIAEEPREVVLLNNGGTTSALLLAKLEAEGATVHIIDADSVVVPKGVKPCVARMQAAVKYAESIGVTEVASPFAQENPQRHFAAIESDVAIAFPFEALHSVENIEAICLAPVTEVLEDA